MTQIPVPNVPTYSKLCVFVQGETYYLKSTFRKEIEQSPSVVLSPILKMENGYEGALGALAEMASSMGISERKTRAAFRFACKRQYAFEQELLDRGKKALNLLDSKPRMFGAVIFGRPYNAFTGDANMGIPHKVASRGYLTIPFDMLTASHYPVDFKMFWGMGQKIMKAAQFVAERENLFGFYITNFSCGPDSFLIGFFRNVMKSKPSLTLELDQHTADAGIDTRIEAALDIITSYRRIAPTLPARGHQLYTCESFLREGNRGERFRREGIRADRSACRSRAAVNGKVRDRGRGGNHARPGDQRQGASCGGQGCAAGRTEMYLM